ncbi:MAG: type II secretion system F family protein [Mariprofundaceae bacterium]
MGLFHYEALDARGRRQRGEIEADSERAARQALKARGLLPRSLAPADAGVPAGSKGRGRLSPGETALFLQQLATLIEAGMPLAEALASIAEGMEKPRARRMIAAVRRQVVEGSTFADALRAQGFEEIICNMVAAGEETGELEAVAMRLSALLERRLALHSDLLSATLYPAIVMGFGVVVMMFLLAVVVPQVVGVFEHAGGELPWLTRAVIGVSDFLRVHGGVLLLGALALVVAWRLAMRWPTPRAWRDRLWLALPGVAGLLVKVDVARFARTLGMLLAGGVPALSAMHIANQGWSMAPLRALGERARESLREGGSLAAALEKGGWLPPMAVRLIRVGEQSGRLDAMLLKLADYYEGEISRSLKRMLTVAEPLLVLLMAVGVGALALAILLPIAEMNELVR